MNSDCVLPKLVFIEISQCWNLKCIFTLVYNHGKIFDNNPLYGILQREKHNIGVKGVNLI